MSASAFVGEKSNDRINIYRLRICICCSGAARAAAGVSPFQRDAQRMEADAARILLHHC
jgi:hypothetical protein